MFSKYSSLKEHRDIIQTCFQHAQGVQLMFKYIDLGQLIFEKINLLYDVKSDKEKRKQKSKLLKSIGDEIIIIYQIIFEILRYFCVKTPGN